MRRKRRQIDEVTSTEQVDALERAAPKKRKRDWDKAKAPDKATYIIGRELKESIKAVAEEHDRPAYYVARRFLEYALSAYRRGELTWREITVKDFELEARDDECF